MLQKYLTTRLFSVQITQEQAIWHQDINRYGDTLRLYRYRVLVHDIASTATNIERFTYSHHHTSTSQSAALQTTYSHFNYHKQHNKFQLFVNKGGRSNTPRLVLAATSREQSYTKDISIVQAALQPWSPNKWHIRNFTLCCTEQCNKALSFKRTKMHP